MKILITLLILIVSVLPAKAVYITTNSFYVNAENTIEIVISGTLTAGVDGSTGALSTGLNINFNITTNEALTDIRLRAYTVDDGANNISSFYCTGSGAVSSQSMFLAFASADNPPTSASINNCKQASSTSTLNPNAIAYSGTVSINNSGTVSYLANGGNGYFTCEVLTGETDLNMALTTAAKSGTYDEITALDEPDPYRVEIYLDNIP